MSEPTQFKIEPMRHSPDMTSKEFWRRLRSGDFEVIHRDTHDEANFSEPEIPFSPDSGPGLGEGR